MKTKTAIVHSVLPKSVTTQIARLKVWASVDPARTFLVAKTGDKWEVRLTSIVTGVTRTASGVRGLKDIVDYLFGRGKD